MERVYYTVGLSVVNIPTHNMPYTTISYFMGNKREYAGFLAGRGYTDEILGTALQILRWHIL